MIDKLIDDFDLLAEAPNGIPELRKMILQVAVQGRLVPQDPDDEPASALLEHIDAEKGRLVREGKIREGKPLPPVDTDAVPYELPTSWEWIRIGNAINMVNGRAFKPVEWATTGLPIVRIQNLNNPEAPYNYCELDIDEKFHVHDGDFLISWSGTPGTSFGAFIWEGEDALLNQHIFRCDLYGGFAKEYLRLAINAELDEMISQAHGGVGLRHITKGKLERMLITLPPLAEQKQIVAKVDQLMALCDELEARQKERAAKRVALNGSCLHALTTAETPKPFATAAKRVFDHFEALYETPETVAEQRQTILQLAVQGKLVPQDPNDERAQQASMEELVGRKNMKNGLSVKQTTMPSPYYCLRLSALRNGIVDCSEGKPVPLTPDEAEPYLIHKDDVFLVRGNGSKDLVGRVGLVEDEPAGAIFPDLFVRLPLDTARISSGYFLIAWNSPQMRYQIEKVAKTTSGIWKVNQGHIASMSLPLPPLGEQERIVAKVDQLMALCDELETKLTQAQADADALAASIVHHLCNPSADKPREAAS